MEENWYSLTEVFCMSLPDATTLFLGGSKNGSFKSSDKARSKFNRVAKIQNNWSEIDQKLRHWLENTNSMTERKVCAFAVLLMSETGIRVGNEGSAEGYVSKAPKTLGQTLKTYGLTTLKCQHVSFEFTSTETIDTSDSTVFRTVLLKVPVKMILDFVGKKSVEHFIEVTDSLLVRIGYEIWKQQSEPEKIWLSFGYKEKQPVTVRDISNFIRRSIRTGLSPKDFRAFRGNIEAARTADMLLLNNHTETSKKEIKQEVKTIIERVAIVLGNTPSASKRYYICPDVLEKHRNQKGWKTEFFRKNKKRREKLVKI